MVCILVRYRRRNRDGRSPSVLGITHQRTEPASRPDPSGAGEGDGMRIAVMRTHEIGGVGEHPSRLRVLRSAPATATTIALPSELDTR
jgi:hypothetical protein